MTSFAWIYGYLLFTQSMGHLLDCPAIQNLHFSGLLTSSRNFFNPQTVYSAIVGEEVAVVFREPLEYQGGNLLVGVYYCGRYSLASEEVVVPPIRYEEPLPDTFVTKLREIVLNNSEDRYLARIRPLVNDSRHILAFAVTHDRRLSIDHHLRHIVRPEVVYEGGSLDCGSIKFQVLLPSLIVKLTDSESKLDSKELFPLCFVLPDVLQRRGQATIIASAGNSAVYAPWQIERGVVVVCPGSTDLPRNRIYPNTPREVQARKFLTNSRGFHFFSFTAFCVDDNGTPVWISGRPLGQQVVKLQADMQWAKTVSFDILLARTFPVALSARVQAHEPKRVIAEPASEVKPSKCVPVDELKFDGVFTTFNYHTPYTYEPLWGTPNVIITGRDIGLIFSLLWVSSESPMTVLGVLYCGRFYTVDYDLRPQFGNSLTFQIYEMGLLLDDSQLRRFRNGVSSVIESSANLQAPNLTHPADAVISIDSAVHQRLASYTEDKDVIITCGKVSMTFNRVLVDPFKPILTQDSLKVACYLGVDAVAVKPSPGENSDSVDGSFIGYETIHCPGGREVAREGKKFFIQACVNEQGIPDWLVLDSFAESFPLL